MNKKLTNKKKNLPKGNEPNVARINIIYLFNEGFMLQSLMSDQIIIKIKCRQPASFIKVIQNWWYLQYINEIQV